MTSFTTLLSSINWEARLACLSASWLFPLRIWKKVIELKDGIIPWDLLIIWFNIVFFCRLGIVHMSYYNHRVSQHLQSFFSFLLSLGEVHKQSIRFSVFVCLPSKPQSISIFNNPSPSYHPRVTFWCPSNWRVHLFMDLNQSTRAFEDNLTIHFAWDGELFPRTWKARGDTHEAS